MKQHKKSGKEGYYSAQQEVNKALIKTQLVNTTQPIRKDGTVSKRMILFVTIQLFSEVEE